MKGVTIFDLDSRTGALSFDLRDILELLGADVVRSMWMLKEVECLGAEAADALHWASDNKKVLDGFNFLTLAQNVNQVIDGEFSGRLPNDDRDWVVIRAVDSSAYDVLTDRESILMALKEHFDCVQDIPKVD